jgi:hypothetical protein
MNNNLYEDHVMNNNNLYEDHVMNNDNSNGDLINYIYKHIKTEYLEECGNKEIILNIINEYAMLTNNYIYDKQQKYDYLSCKFKVSNHFIKSIFVLNDIYLIINNLTLDHKL